MAREYGWFCDIETGRQTVVLEFRHDKQTQNYFIRNRVVHTASTQMNLDLTGNVIPTDMPDNYTIDVCEPGSFIEYAIDKQVEDDNSELVVDVEPKYVFYSMVMCVLWCIACA